MEEMETNTRNISKLWENMTKLGQQTEANNISVDGSF